MANFSNKDHSRLSASGSAIWTNCPGSVKLSETAPPRDPHPSAMEGSIAHEVAEVAVNLLLGLSNDSHHDLIGEIRSDVVIDRAMIIGATLYAEFVASIYQQGDTIDLEKRVTLEHVHPDMFGTADCIIKKQDGSIHVIDYKYGTWPVSAKQNSQMIYYAIGASKEYTPPYVTLNIVQPRSKDGKTIKSDRIEKEQMYMWERVFREQAKLADVGTPIVKGKHCMFCPALPVCPMHQHDTPHA